MQYGKRITTESYFGGTLKKNKIEYQIPELIQDKNDAVREFMKGLQHIINKETHKVTFVVEADPKTHYFKLVTKQYQVEE